MTDDEIRAAMTQYKVDNPQIDWDTLEVYAIVDEETKEIVRIGAADTARIMGFSGGVDE